MSRVFLAYLLLGDLSFLLPKDLKSILTFLLYEECCRNVAGIFYKILKILLATFRVIVESGSLTRASARSSGRYSTAEDPVQHGEEEGLGPYEYVEDAPTRLS